MWLERRATSIRTNIGFLVFSWPLDGRSLCATYIVWNNIVRGRSLWVTALFTTFKVILQETVICLVTLQFASHFLNTEDSHEINFFISNSIFKSLFLMILINSFISILFLYIFTTPIRHRLLVEDVLSNTFIFSIVFLYSSSLSLEYLTFSLLRDIYLA